jgi:leader peptidase (prepilin peptidase)/N-methyltransferase
MLDSPTLSAFFDANPWQLYVLLGVLGLLVGSFLNVVILRLPEVMRREWTRDCRALLELDTSDTPASTDDEHFSLAFPGSHCPNCNAAIQPWQNIPVVSWLLLRGRCASCDIAIGLRYPLVELFTAIATVTVGVYTGWSIVLPAYLLLTWALVALAGIDIDTQLLPDDITLPLLWAGLLFNLFLGPIPIADAVLGAAAGYLLLWSIYWLFKLVTGKEGMGFGDFKLLAALGAWLGWQALPGIILLSSAVGAVLGLIILALRGQGRSQPLPFGPYLAAAGWISLLWGHQISALFFHSV